MRGYSHAASGLVAGAAAGLILHKSLGQDIALSGLTAGMALLPDMDTAASCASRSLGPVSGAVAYVIRKGSGGHRHFSHSALGVGAFTGAAFLAGHFRHDLGGKAGLGLLLTVAVAGALDALHFTKAAGHLDDLAGVAVAAAVVFLGWGLALIPLAVAVGTSAHLLGDCLTVQGCPLLLPVTKSHQFALPPFLRFTTGHWQERFVVDPLLFAVLGVLAIQAADPSLLSSGWHAFTSAA